MSSPLPVPVNDSIKADVLAAFDVSLQRIGYPSPQIQHNYGFSNFLEDGRRHTVDLAAFGNAVPSLRTCNIGVLVTAKADTDDVARLRALGAPLVFTYDFTAKRLGRWRMSADVKPAELETRSDISLDRLQDYFTGHRSDWGPEAFQQARAATFPAAPTQLDFFDVGLLPALEEQLQRKLSAQIDRSAARSREIVNERRGENAFERQFAEYARLLFRLLAAKMLSDRGDLPDLVHATDAAEALIAVEQKYYSGERVDPALSEAVVRNQVWEDLRQGLDLRNLSPETLAFVYENTLTDPTLRRRNGIHATPPPVADYLLRQLPIDRLPEEQRFVFEPFCGNAPFLLAAMRRLRELLPAERPSAQAHRYLTERLLGIEILPVAREIAVCSLILGDYPNDNSWQVVQGDAYKDERFVSFLHQAQVVLSNPPHENFPSEERMVGAHHNRAAEALRRVLETPPPVLGFVMPLSFVDGAQFKALRHRLAEVYPTLNVTALPDNVFSKASQQVALIAAHRLDEAKCYVWAQVSKEDYRTQFLTSGQPTIIEERDNLPADLDGAPILWRRPQSGTAPLWERLAEMPYRRLGEVSEVHRGLRWQQVSENQSPVSSAVSDTKKAGFEPGLHQVNDTIESFLALEVSYLDVQPEHRADRTNALRWEWERPKVLVNATRMSRKIWRLVSVIDTAGLYASQNYIGVWPKRRSAQYNVAIPVEIISAVLNGPVANAYLSQACRGRDNELHKIKRIPVPIFTEVQSNEIIALVDGYLDMRWANADEPTPWTGTLADQGRRALLKVDAAVLDAYALPPELEADLLRLFDGIPRGHLPFAFSGYAPNEWAAAKAELADEREGRRIAKTFQDLLRKSNLHGLTADEQQEYDRLDKERTLRRTRYRASLVETEK